eukprot:1740727-Alexandrium_andersonii.AAC.1
MGAVLVAAAARGALAVPAVSDVGPLLAQPPHAGEWSFSASPTQVPRRTPSPWASPALRPAC